MTDPAIVGDAVKLVASGIRSHGFKGRVPRLSRQLASGTIQTVYLGRQPPFRPPSFSIGLTVIPAALMEGWSTVAPEALKAYETARFSADDLGFSADLDHADGRLEGRHHAPATPAEAERVAAEVIEQFSRAGLPWLDHWSDPGSVATEIGDIEREPPGYGFTQALAASLLEVLPSSSPTVVALLDQTVFVLSYWRDRMATIAVPGSPLEAFDPGLDDWLLDRLSSRAGFLPDRSMWPERQERLTRRLEERRSEAQGAYGQALEALGFGSVIATDDDLAEARGKLARILGPKLSAILEPGTAGHDTRDT